jgi:hypothetical protein
MITPRLIALVPLCCVLVACESKVTEENFAKISVGMTKSSVFAILGEGEEQTVGGMGITGGGLMSGPASNRQITYVWKDQGREISVTFENDKVVNKAMR